MARPATHTAICRELGARGATLRELSALFDMQQLTAERRLARRAATGNFEGIPTWTIKEVATDLAPLPADVVGRVIRMNHMDLPPVLRKEYFDGQLKHMKLLELEGQIWRTEAVQQYVGTAFRDIKLEIQLLSDILERSTELSERQRQIAAEAIDGCLRGLRSKLLKLFDNLKDDTVGRGALEILDSPGVEDDPWDGL